MVIGQTGERVDMVVVGGGPGGYSAAIRGAQLGQSVVLIERDAIGGVCLNHGCIPSKALLSAAQLADRARRGTVMGIDARVDVDLVRLQAWKRSVVAKLTGGVRGLLDRWGVRVMQGTARLASERRVAVDLGEDVTFFEFQAAVLATGSRARNGGGLSPEQALDLATLPDRIVVVGSDYISAELATAFARLGRDVTLIAQDDHVLPELGEPPLSRAVAGGLRKLGVSLMLSTTAERIEDSSVAYRTSDGAAMLTDVLVVNALRRLPNTDDLGLADAGLRPLDDGTLRVDAHQRTAVHHIFAVGDMTPGPALAHRAMAEGRVAAEVAAGLPSAMDPSVMPFACFTEPEVAAVGLSEKSARARVPAVASARFPLAASGRAVTLEEPEGFVQVVFEQESGRLLGIQIAGSNATDLAGEAALAIEMGATLDDLALTLHPHPTIAESFVEAADVALGRPRHIYRTVHPPRY